MPSREFDDQIAEWSGWIEWATGAKTADERSHVRGCLIVLVNGDDPETIREALLQLQQMGALSGAGRNRIEAAGAAHGPHLQAVAAELYRLRPNTGGGIPVW